MKDKSDKLYIIAKWLLDSQLGGPDPHAKVDRTKSQI